MQERNQRDGKTVLEEKEFYRDVGFSTVTEIP
jgi:hypothetical protein